MDSININRLKIIDQFLKPYPLIIYSNILDIPHLNDLQRFLANEKTKFDKTVMGNRMTIIKGTSNFKKLLNEVKVGNDINNFFEKKSVFEYFYNNLEKLNINNKNSYDLQNKKFKFLKKFISNRGSANNTSLTFRFKNRLSKIFSKINNDCSLYSDLDFSVAAKGYWREPHHDSEERIMNFLLYINDFDGDNGGNFQIFKYKKNPQKYLKQPNLNDLELVRNIEPKRGYLVTFLSSPNSLHGVDVIKKTNEKRYFLYGSYTALKKIEWKTNI